MDHTEAKLIANALYEIRPLLSLYIGTENDAPADARFAAHLAYALHNKALASAAGTGFDVLAALEKVAAIDSVLATDDGKRLAHSWGTETKNGAWYRDDCVADLNSRFGTKAFCRGRSPISGSSLGRGCSRARAVQRLCYTDLFTKPPSAPD